MGDHDEEVRNYRTGQIGMGTVTEESTFRPNAKDQVVEERPALKCKTIPA